MARYSLTEEMPGCEEGEAVESERLQRLSGKRSTQPFRNSFESRHASA